MKIFDTFEEVPGMFACKKKPVIVHAIQINEPFKCNSLEGNYKTGKKGDYLIKGIDGENYICDKEIFEKTYDILENEIILHDEFGKPKLNKIKDFINKGDSDGN